MNSVVLELSQVAAGRRAKLKPTGPGIMMPVSRVTSHELHWLWTALGMLTYRSDPSRPGPRPGRGRRSGGLVTGRGGDGGDGRTPRTPGWAASPTLTLGV